jgi:predicted phosphodiesterase
MSMLAADGHQFSFAIIGDTHVKPESGDQSAPWKVNDLATARARWIAREIVRYSPSFVIHLGDLVHPVPELPTFGEAAALTKRVFQSQHNSLHIIPGNHDIGDKPNRMMPAKSVRDEWIAIHEKNFGPSWSSFDRGDVRFVLINNPVLNSGSATEAAQRSWLEEQLASAEGRRLFLFMHYPLFLLAPDEPGTYDNIDEPARSDLLALIAKHRVEAVFAGHVHNIFYHRVGPTEFYVMPATSFVRQDYAEMYRVEAAAENGRNDAEKLGFAIVDVYAGGHAVDYLRSYGELLSADAPPVLPEKRTSVLLPHPKKTGGAPLGAFLRHPWAEVVSLPHNGPMDEFHRKQARNDYSVAALWRLGMRHVRIPLPDLTDGPTRSRISDLVAIGHRFTVFGFDLPQGRARQTVLENRGLIDRFEIILPRDSISERSQEIGIFRRELGRSVLVSPVATSADEVKVGSKIELFVAHGYRPSETVAVDELVAADPLAGVDGFVFRAHLSDDLPAVAARLDAWSRKSGRKADCHLRIASSNPAQNIIDDAGILSGAAELFALALAYPEITFMIDTFMDIDRGYFVRHGLIDRRCNLRPAGHAIEALTAHLCRTAGPWSLSVRDGLEGRIVALGSSDCVALLLLPEAGRTLPAPRDLLDSPSGYQAIPLDRPWTIDPAIGTASGGRDLPAAFGGPTLLVSRQAR